MVGVSVAAACSVQRTTCNWLCRLPQHDSQRCRRLSRPLLFAAHHVPESSPDTTTVADAWATEIWSVPSSPQPAHAANLVLGTPPRVTGLVTLLPDELHPIHINKASLLQHLQSQLISRQSAKLGVQAIVLSGPYLPSQIAVITELSSKLQLYTSCFISGTQLHLLVSRQPALQVADSSTVSTKSSKAQPPELTWVKLLSSELGGNIQPLPEGRLQAAQDIEQKMTQQLRLFSPVEWSSALQQRLLTRKRVQSVIAVRSLMAPAALESVRQLVQKVGLHLFEVDRELPTEGATGMSTSGSGGRRRKKTDDTAQASAADSSTGSHLGCTRELVLVVSVVPFDAEDLAELPAYITADAFTDYQPGGIAGLQKNGLKGKSAWWDLGWGQWFVRESQATDP